MIAKTTSSVPMVLALPRPSQSTLSTRTQEHRRRNGRTRACHLLHLRIRTSTHGSKGYDASPPANGEILEGRLFSLTAYIAGRKELLATNQRGISRDERDVLTQLNIAQLIVENLNSEGIDLEDYNAFTKRFPDPKIVSY